MPLSASEFTTTARAFLAIILAGLSGCSSPTAPATVPSAQTAQVAKEVPTPKQAATPKIITAPVAEIDASQLFALREAGKALTYDVRLPLYYKLGHIKGAILFYPKPFDAAFDPEKSRMEAAVREGKTIVLYCGGADCNDSHVVGKMIAERGIPVSVYSGGWAEWKEIGIE